jgi:hypothetical protein
MKATLLYRIASVAFILFALGHTVGFLTFRPPTPEGLAVWDAMNHVHFHVDGSDFSYGVFYIGFGLSATVSMLFQSYIAWHLGALARNNPKAIGAFGWAFTLVQVAGLILSLKYFAAIPAILSAIVVLCLGWAAWQVRSRPA